MSESLDKLLDLIGISEEKTTKEYRKEEMVIVKK